MINICPGFFEILVRKSFVQVFKKNILMIEDDWQVVVGRQKLSLQTRGENFGQNKFAAEITKLIFMTH